MRREADYTIHGFLYQFHKTLAVVLASDDDSLVTVEDMVEDIDVADQNGITAIQCK
jgi:hypothetical protein